MSRKLSMVSLSEANRDIWKYLRSKWLILLFFIVLALMVKLVFYKFTSADLEIFLLDWFDYYDQVPIKEALSRPISNYTGPYTYLLLLAKLAQRGITSVGHIRIPDISMIKLIDLPFEFLSIYSGLVILRYFTANERTFFYGFALLLFHPIVLLNGAFWGQCDIIYTSLLLASIMMILYGKNFWGIIFFASAFSFKFQAMFFAPFVLALIFAGKMRWYWLGSIPVVYLILHIPSILAGMLILDILTIYLQQANSMPVLTANAPNLYQFLPALSGSGIVIGRIIGLVVTVTSAVVYAWYSAKHGKLSDRNGLLLGACVILVLMPFLMPSMLDRYFFPAEIFLLLLAISQPKWWLLPVMVSFASLLVYYNSYGVITLGLNAAPSKAAAAINSAALLIVLYLFLRKKEKAPDPENQVLQVKG